MLTGQAEFAIEPLVTPVVPSTELKPRFGMSETGMGEVTIPDCHSAKNTTPRIEFIHGVRRTVTALKAKRENLRGDEI